MGGGRGVGRRVAGISRVGENKSAPPMSKALLSGEVFRPLAAVRSRPRRPYAGICCVGVRIPCAGGAGSSTGRWRRPELWAVRSSGIGDQIRPRQDVPQGAGEAGEVDMAELVEFLYEDLPHLFDDQGIDRSKYDERVRFRDPITSHDTVDGYLFNIALLKLLFRPDFQLHYVKQVPWISP